MSEPEAPGGQENINGTVPLGVAVEATGDTEVDLMVERLGDTGALPTEDHIQVYEDVHRGLREALTALDDNRS